jgi:hypothetical protein
VGYGRADRRLRRLAVGPHRPVRSPPPGRTGRRGPKSVFNQDPRRRPKAPPGSWRARPQAAPRPATPRVGRGQAPGGQGSGGGRVERIDGRAEASGAG